MILWWYVLVFFSPKKGVARVTLCNIILSGVERFFRLWLHRSRASRHFATGHVTNPLIKSMHVVVQSNVYTSPMALCAKFCWITQSLTWPLQANGSPFQKAVAARFTSPSHRLSKPCNVASAGLGPTLCRSCFMALRRTAFASSACRSSASALIRERKVSRCSSLSFSKDFWDAEHSEAISEVTGAWVGRSKVSTSAKQRETTGSGKICSKISFPSNLPSVKVWCSIFPAESSSFSPRSPSHSPTSLALKRSPIFPSWDSKPGAASKSSKSSFTLANFSGSPGAASIAEDVDAPTWDWLFTGGAPIGVLWAPEPNLAGATTGGAPALLRVPDFGILICSFCRSSANRCISSRNCAFEAFPASSLCSCRFFTSIYCMCRRQ